MRLKEGSKMSEENNENVTTKDLLAFRIEAERRLTVLETSLNALKEDVTELKSGIEVLREEINKYKWWVLTGFVSSTLLAVLLKIILGV